MFAKLKKKIAEEAATAPRSGVRIPRTISKESITSVGADSGDDFVSTLKLHILVCSPILHHLLFTLSRRPTGDFLNLLYDVQNKEQLKQDKFKLGSCFLNSF